jgi:hypothetical protein
MAKATIVFEDADDGTTTVRVTFDPPVTTQGEASAAQCFALQALTAVREEKEEGEDFND